MYYSHRGWCSTALDECMNCCGDTQMMALLAPLTFWSVWWSKMGRGRPLAVDDQPLVSDVSVCTMCVFCRMCLCEVWTTVSVQSLCWDKRFDSNLCPTESISPFLFSFFGKHTYIHKHAGCQWGSEQSPLQRLPLLSQWGIFNLSPREKQEKKALSSLASASLAPSLTLCVSVTHHHTLSRPPFLPLPLCLISFFPPFSFLLSLSLAVNRLHCSLCQSSVSEPQVKH